MAVELACIVRGGRCQMRPYHVNRTRHPGARHRAQKSMPFPALAARAQRAGARSGVTPLERALQALARAPLKDFVRERRRLADDLRRRDKGAAARLATRRKPAASVWAVNQLYWQARPELDALLKAASALRRGDVSANRDYRTALAALRAAAAEILRRAGLGSGDAAMRRIVTTLSALAAAGGFAPNPSGALEHELEAPGFDAIGVAARPAAPRSPAPATKGRGAARARAALDPPSHAAGSATPIASHAAAGRRREAARRRAAERARARAERTTRRELERAATRKRRALQRLATARLAAGRKASAADRRLAALEQQLARVRESAQRPRRAVAEIDRRIDDLRGMPRP